MKNAVEEMRKAGIDVLRSSALLRPTMKQDLRITRV